MSGIAPWMIWAIFAIVMIIAEAITSGFFLLFIGIGALPAAVAAALGLPPTLQFAVFVISSIILLVFCRRIVVRLSSGTSDNVGANRMMGRKGMVIETIDRARAKGKVRVDRDIWNAEPDSGDIISEGAWVEVVRVDGTRLIVKEAAPE